MRRTNLFFVKVTKEHRGKNGRQSVRRIFFRLSRWNSANFPSAVLVGVFGIVFNCRPHFRSHIHSQCGLFFIKNIDLYFQQCESKKRIACVIYLCSIVGIIFLFLLFCFLCGLSIWGAYCVPLAPLFRGFGMGITAGYLYAAYGFQGFLFHLAVILPGAFICLIAILIASRESMLFSKKIHLGRKTEEQEAQPKNNVRHFFIRFSILTGILIIGALVDVLTTVCFSGLFVF
ncbi:MAG: stage II sporulation protein M [Acutalibacteraceae bacterium]